MKTLILLLQLASFGASFHDAFWDAEKKIPDAPKPNYQAAINFTTADAINFSNRVRTQVVQQVQTNGQGRRSR